MKCPRSGWVRWVPTVVLISTMGLIAALAVDCFVAPSFELRLIEQKSGDVILTSRVAPGDRLTLRLTHSFEHVPWNEYYIIQEDGTFLLKRIEVGGFGAGIPAEMDVPTYVGEDGLVHMDEINSVFPRFNWITSQVNMKDLLLNDEAILQFADLPHHSFVSCEIQTPRRLFHFG